jgi:glutamate-1-semialdehyde 2,1-aminomutase
VTPAGASTCRDPNVHGRKRRGRVDASLSHDLGKLSAHTSTPACPPDFASGGGCRLVDIDGNSYIDFSSSNGSSMLGFNHPQINAAVQQALTMGTITTQETEHHVRLGERLTQTIPGADKVRFSNTGTEATMAAIRIARAATGREKIVKFDGHFHGMHDYVLYNAHSPDHGRQLVVPNDRDSKGIPAALDDLLYTIPFNDVEAVDNLFSEHGDEIAAAILEPVSFNQGCVRSDRDWLVHLCAVTERHGTALIFDEVLSGFRFALGSSAEYYGVIPDLTAWAKALAAGWPLAAVTGRDWVYRAKTRCPPATCRFTSTTGCGTIT